MLWSIESRRPCPAARMQIHPGKIHLDCKDFLSVEFKSLNRISSRMLSISFVCAVHLKSLSCKRQVKPCCSLCRERVVEVQLGDRSYPIYIGSNLPWNKLLQAHIPGKTALVVTNTTIAPLYLDRCSQYLTPQPLIAWQEYMRKS